MALTEDDKRWFERQLEAFETKLLEAFRSTLALRKRHEQRKKQE